MKKYKIKKFLKEKVLEIYNLFKPTEGIDEAKKKWNDLAQKNARYFVLTDKGESISEEEFSGAGEKDVREHFLDDKYIKLILANNPDISVLEIGCGIGRLSEFISPHVGELYGVDISEEMIERAKKRLVHINNAQFFATDGLSFPLGDKSMDLVFSFIVFQHMPSREIIRKNIEEIARVLKSDGIAKIQLRGIPVSKGNWYYGPSFNSADVQDLISGLPLSLLNIEGEGNKYFWVWLKN